MKLKSLILAVLAGGALLASCQQEKPIYGISTDKDVLEFTAEGGQAAVQVTTGQAWTVSIPADAQEWLVANPTSGTGSASVVFTAAANAGKDRKAGVKIKAGMSGYVNVAVNQAGSVAAGDGLTPETAWSASEANAWVKANLTDKQVTTEKYYIKGKIHKVQTTFAASGDFGNAVFFMSDNGQAASDDFEAYQVYYLEGKKWVKGQPDVEVGDDVIIYGPVTLYGSTAETSGKGAAFIYSHLRNGETPTPPEEEDYTKAEAKTVAEFIAAADANTYYKLTGTVSSFNKTYCSFDLTDATGKIYVYSVLADYKTEWADKIKNGGTITIAAKYKKYNDKDEAVDAAILAYEDGQGGGEEDYTKAEAKTVAEFIAAADKNTYYKLTGTVTSFNATYCSFDLTDETGTIYVYSVLDAYKTDEWKNKIKNGGTITIAGKYDYYSSKSQHEVVQAAFLEFTEGETPTEFEDLTVAEFITKADATKPYRLAGKVESYVVTNKDKGYMTFNLVDATGSILVYSLATGQFAEWGEKIQDGGSIVLVGTYKLYNNTPEVVDATIESFEADPNYKYCKVDKKTINVAATDTEVEIKVEANAAWAISQTTNHAGVSVNPASGEADATVKVTIPANTSTEAAVEYTFMLACEAASVEETITITQGKASSGNETIVNVDFVAENADLPQGSANKATDGTYTLGGQAFVMHAADGFYQAKNGDKYYLLIGKQGSYIQLPVIDGKALKKIEFKTGEGASTSVIVDVTKDGTALEINTGALNKNTEYSWNVAGETGVAYRLQVMSMHNAQYQYIKLTYE